MLIKGLCEIFSDLRSKDWHQIYKVELCCCLVKKTLSNLLTDSYVPMMKMMICLYIKEKTHLQIKLAVYQTCQRFSLTIKYCLISTLRDLSLIIINKQHLLCNYTHIHTVVLAIVETKFRSVCAVMWSDKIFALQVSLILYCMSWTWKCFISFSRHFSVSKLTNEADTNTELRVEWQRKTSWTHWGSGKACNLFCCCQSRLFVFG